MYLLYLDQKEDLFEFELISYMELAVTANMEIKRNIFFF